MADILAALRVRASAAFHAAASARPDFAARFDAGARGAAGPSGLATVSHFGEALIVPADPQTLTHMLPDDAAGSLRSKRFVLQGDWSAAVSPVANDAVFQEMRDLVTLRERFAQGEAHAVLLERARRGERTLRNGTNLDDREAIDRYMRHYLALVTRIESEGFQRHRRCGDEPGDMRPRLATLRETDVCVAVGPTGDLLRFVGGRHRAAIAAHLRLCAIPVLVRGVHAKFLLAEAARRRAGPYHAFRAWLAQRSQKSRSA